VRLMRHASITTTMNTYGQLFQNELADTTTSIGPMFEDHREALALSKTGSDDRPAAPLRSAACSAYDSAQEGAREHTRAKLLTRSSPGGIRTPDQGIMSPLL